MYTKKISLTAFTIFLIIFSFYNFSVPHVLSQNYLHDFSPTNADSTINLVVEIPAGTNEKWEVTKPDGKLELEHRNGKPRIVAYLGYPGNYGMIPGTLLSEETGGDGDPLDVLAIGSPVARGKVIRAKIIGVLRFLDRGEQDDKLLAVLPETALYTVNTISELNKKFPGIAPIIQTWFINYKGAGVMEFKGLGTPQEAREILRKAVNEYQKSRKHGK